jgi:hypothetical protein
MLQRYPEYFKNVHIGRFALSQQTSLTPMLGTFLPLTPLLLCHTSRFITRVIGGKSIYSSDPPHQISQITQSIWQQASSAQTQPLRSYIHQRRSSQNTFTQPNARNARAKVATVQSVKSDLWDLSKAYSSQY